jgi:hypothetical protein
MLAGKMPETEERLACSAWDGCRTAGEGSGARTGWASKRGSPSKPITCKIVLPFWKSESWARRGQLVATRVYSLLLLCAPLLVFLYASAMIEGNTAEDGKGIDRLFMHVALPVRQKKKVLHEP